MSTGTVSSMEVVEEEPFVTPASVEVQRKVKKALRRLGKSKENAVPQEVNIQYIFDRKRGHGLSDHPFRGYRCGVCTFDCGGWTALLSHLELCHPKFTFTFAEGQDGQKTIRVADISSSPTKVIATSDKKLLSEPEMEKTFKKDLVTGVRPPTNDEVQSLHEIAKHKQMQQENNLRRMLNNQRTFYHSQTCAPIVHREFDIDSEDENDPEFLRTQFSMMIDDYSDINEGEKNIMKLWNLYVLNKNVIANCHIPNACRDFVIEFGNEIIKQNLYNNFVLHLTNLFDCGLLSPAQVHCCITKLQEKMLKSD